MSTLRRLGRAFADVIVPPLCPSCGVRGDATRFCPACLDGIELLDDPRCAVCAQPGRFLGESAEEARCDLCVDGRAFGAAAAFGAFRGSLSELLRRFKYGRERSLARALGRLAREAAEARFDPDGYDAIVPVPLHRGRFVERGFNQSFLLAEAVAAGREAPLVHLLRRARGGPPQAGRQGEDRAANVAGAFALDPRAGSARDLTLLLVDDVFTTGATAEACAEALLAGGAARVDVVTVARTP